MACCLVEVEACHLGEVVWRQVGEAACCPEVVGACHLEEVVWHQEVEVACCLEVVGACHLEEEEVWRRAAAYWDR